MSIVSEEEELAAEATFVDSRATAVDDPVPLPEGLTQLTPEEVAAATEASPETVDEATQAAMMKAAYEAAAAKENELTEFLADKGTYVLIRFQNPTSIRNIIKFSEPRPEDRTVVAVLDRIVREMRAYEVRNWMAGADALDAETKKESEDSMLRQMALKRGLPVNRQTLRKLRAELRAAENE